MIYLKILWSSTTFLGLKSEYERRNLWVLYKFSYVSLLLFNQGKDIMYLSRKVNENNFPGEKIALLDPWYL